MKMIKLDLIYVAEMRNIYTASRAVTHSHVHNVVIAFILTDERSVGANNMHYEHESHSNEGIRVREVEIGRETTYT